MLTEPARAKINLTLRVIGRRDDGYHQLESLVAFAGLADTLTLEPGADTSLAVTGPTAQASGDPASNLVLKACRALAETVPDLKGGRFTLDKRIPVAAGVGGGSADAAAALRLLARVNGLARDDVRLMTAALRCGADVPVCLESRACLMAGVGERLSPPLDLPKLHAVLVNPRVPLSTRDVFAAYAADARTGPPLPPEVPRGRGELLDYLKANGNDLTDAAIVCAPMVQSVLDVLGVLPGVELARMSGSGATCFAIFASAAESADAAQRLAAAHGGWWTMSVEIG